MHDTLIPLSYDEFYALMQPDLFVSCLRHLFIFCNTFLPICHAYGILEQIAWRCDVHYNGKPTFHTFSNPTLGESYCILYSTNSWVSHITIYSVGCSIYITNLNIHEQEEKPKNNGMKLLDNQGEIK